MFLLVSCSFAYQNVLCFVHGQDQRTKEIENKETVEFHNQSCFINYGLRNVSISISIFHANCIF